MSRALLALALALPATASAHAGHVDPAPWAACEHEDLGASCAWEDSARSLYRGTCRSMSDALVCVRNQPIVRAEARADHGHSHPAPVTPLQLGGGLAVAVALVGGVLGAATRGEGAR